MDKPAVPYCRSSVTDGECYSPECPQLRDGEPEATGRYCPRAAAWEAYWEQETGDPQGRA